MFTNGNTTSVIEELLSSAFCHLSTACCTTWSIYWGPSPVYPSLYQCPCGCLWLCLLTFLGELPRMTVCLLAFLSIESLYLSTIIITDDGL